MPDNYFPSVYSFMLRNYSTKFRNIYKNCILCCSLNRGCKIKTGLNNPRNFKIILASSCGDSRSKKPANLCLNIRGFTQIFHSNFKNIKDNSFSSLNQKLFNRFAQHFQEFWCRLDKPRVLQLLQCHLADSIESEYSDSILEFSDLKLDT